MARLSASRARSGSRRCPARKRYRCSMPTTTARSRSGGRSACGAPSALDGARGERRRSPARPRAASACRCPRAPSARPLSFARLRDVLQALEHADAPLFVHPGPWIRPADAARVGPERPSRRSRTHSGGRRSRATSRRCTRRGSPSPAPGARSTRACAWSSRCWPGSPRCTPSGCSRAGDRTPTGRTRCSSTRPPPMARGVRAARGGRGRRATALRLGSARRRPRGARPRGQVGLGPVSRVPLRRALGQATPAPVRPRQERPGGVGRAPARAGREEATVR